MKLLSLLVLLSLSLPSFASQPTGEQILKQIVLAAETLPNRKVENINMAPALVGALEGLAKKNYIFYAPSQPDVSWAELVANDFSTEGVLAIVKVEDNEFHAVLRVYTPIEAGDGMVESAWVYVNVYGAIHPQTKKVVITKYELAFRGIS